MSEVWMCSTPEKLNIEEWGSILVLHLLPRFLFLLCSSLWTGIFTFDFLPVLLLPILWFVAPIEAWNSPRKGLSKEKCTISNVCLLGPANDPPRPPDKVSKEVVLPVHYLAVTVHDHFQRFVIKALETPQQSFPSPLLWLNNLYHLLWTGERGDGSKRMPIYCYHYSG